MKLESRIRQKIESELKPSYLELENESHQHSGPVHAETHFRLLVVSAQFEGVARLQRQRRINEILKEELQEGVHALSQRAMTPSEWESAKDHFKMVSPSCRGGSKGSSS